MKNTTKEILKRLHEAGHEVSVEWDGGDDSGCYYLKVDDERIEDVWDGKGDGRWETDVIDAVADELSYGSFAGSFYTNGELVFDGEEFSGTDYYSERDGEKITFDPEEDDVEPIVVKVPKDLWFDSITIDIQAEDLHEGADIDDGEITFRFRITNGPVVEEHSEWENKLETKFAEDLNNAMGYIRDKVDGTIENIYDDMTLNYSDFKPCEDDPNFIEATVDGIHVSLERTSDKDVCIHVGDSDMDDDDPIDQAAVEAAVNQFNNK